MFSNHKRLALPVLPLALGLGAAGALAAGQVGSASGPLSCEIEATPAAGMIVLEGLVHADQDVRGSYRFRIKSAGRSGSSNVSQGGSFAAGPGAAATLGKVMLGNNGAYDASLEVTADGARVECAKRVGGAI
jgi:hypothetical protein